MKSLEKLNFVTELLAIMKNEPTRFSPLHIQLVKFAANEHARQAMQEIV